ncbi:MAG: 4'-phosphopantetheinyl transferase superfamily protein [Desulfobulbus sp.]|jgi:4'-phosphopantetheinyl transferase EntD|uniref:4'-phosphopantetheinyl transferase superfamily protein n=1 Tax=Desulfobulbus sp. TaxID=895 RepID=UPI0028485818|nr:4'-phosphopantetheinyl transferase superfamily protein [Desulfobulbus sp.]MDR2549403.1 4'-phosphopantetheinyl transferase superfamily protein [Desulfobulbus sp.]
MTSICPESSVKTCQLLPAHLECLAERYRILAPSRCRLALLDLRLLPPLIEQPGALAPLLAPDEREIFQRFRYPKRQVEWLGGRVAAKYCLHRLLAAEALPCTWQRYSILADTHGRPCLEHVPADCPGAIVSISHSHGYAAALACRTGSCGVDIQQLTPKLAGVAERFASGEELALIDSELAPLTRLGLIWAAKEAVKKCLLPDHPSFFGRIRLTRLEQDQKTSGWRAQCRIAQPKPMAATVHLAEVDGHLLACATGDAHA